MNQPIEQKEILPRDRVFTAPLEQWFLNSYRRIFSIEEIEHSKILQWVFGATLFSYFVAFNSWIGNSATTIDSITNNSHLCWPYFQECGKLLFLRALPQGYSQPFLYMVLFGTLLISVYCMYRKDWVLAHLALVPSFLWHTFAMFVLTMSLSGNYEYYLFFFSLILLFFPYKEFFLKLALVFFYFLSTAAKIHETWILGTYFSSLVTGLPLFPRWSIPFFTNLIIFMEMVGSWFLLSRRPILQRTALIFFVMFHLYSGLLVEYRYVVTVLPTLLILFGPLYSYTRAPLDKKSIIGWLLIVLLFFAQMVPQIIPGDEKLTMEGNKYGLYMFEANHQCVSTAQIIRADGTVRTVRTESASARARCDPYKYLIRTKGYCTGRDMVGGRVAWTFDHSINGGPFYRIVDAPDSCVLIYKAFSHNKWIKTENDNPAIIGKPVENIYD